MLRGLVVVLAVVATVRVKDNSTAINRRQADPAVNDLLGGDKQAIVTPNLNRESVQGGAFVVGDTITPDHC